MNAERGTPEVTDVRADAYRVPTELDFEADGTLTWSATTVVVVHVYAADVMGVGWTYAHHGCVELVRTKLGEVVRGRPLLDVPAAWQAMHRAIRNDGRPGLVSCALAAVEIALWDAAARLLDLSLVRLLGRVHEAVPVYGSGGFVNYDETQLRAQLDRWVEQQHSSVKIKIGEARGCEPARDLERVAYARDVVGDKVDLFVDANGGYSVGEAVRIGRRLDAMGVIWFEEPVSSDDVSGLRRVRQSTGADVTAGEYGYMLSHFGRLLDADAVDCMQIDVTRCGGIGEWLRAAALADARNVAVSGHCAQNLTAHVAAATPNLRHVEWFRDHARIEGLFFDNVLVPVRGRVYPDVAAPGHAMTFKEVDAEPYRISV